MEYEAEDPAGYILATLSPSVLGLRELCESSRNYGVFMTGWIVILPLDPGPLPVFPARVQQSVDRAERVVEWEVFEVDVWWKNSTVTLTDISENTRNWVHD